MLSKELWETIDVAPRYSISSWGNVYDSSRDCLVGFGGTATGYKNVKLQTPTGRRTFLVHRLVARHFISVDLRGLEVNHIDGDKKNNEMSNLEVCTHSHNMLHAFATGLKTATGGKAPNQVRCVETGEVFESQAAAARAIGAFKTEISNVLNRPELTSRGYHFETA